MMQTLTLFDCTPWASTDSHFFNIIFSRFSFKDIFQVRLNVTYMHGVHKSRTQLVLLFRQFVKLIFIYSSPK